MKPIPESTTSRRDPPGASELLPDDAEMISEGLQSLAGAIVQAMREPLLVLDYSLCVKVAVRSFYEAFKTTQEQTLGRSLFELGSGQWNNPALRMLLDDLVRIGAEFNDCEVEYDFPDIGRRTMLLNARRLFQDDNPSQRILLVIDDITERRIVERKLEVSAVRYRRLFEAAHDGILILDMTAHKITEVNPFLMELLDYPRDHFIGKELWEIGVFRDKDANQRAMKELHDKGSIRYEDLPLEDGKGAIHPVEIVANVYQEGDHPVIQCNIRDIAERVQFERERAVLLANEHASRTEAEAANRSKDLFLATLSHEVRTPLNAILGWATILRDGKCSEADVKEGMEVIERNCKAQAQLIEDVLDISRIVSGKLRLEIHQCELSEAINAAIDVVRPAAAAKGVRLETILDPAASLASCDINRMQQVFWNLLSNAIKFSPKGKSVRISLARERSMARIQVMDDGQGISAEFLPFVFDRFRQADGSTRRKLGGLGLGLSIVKHIVETHGGTVHAESAGEGLGSIFTVDLPVRAVNLDEGDYEAGCDPKKTPKSNLAPVRLDGLKVLVVDDEADARRLLVKVLGEAGAIVTGAASVPEALAALATNIPHVLVSDLAMPNQDGFDLIREVRGAGHSAAELPAVALTAFAHKDDRLRVLQAGFQIHVTKPIDPHELTRVIATLVGHKA